MKTYKTYTVELTTEEIAMISYAIGYLYRTTNNNKHVEESQKIIMKFMKVMKNDGGK